MRSVKEVIEILEKRFEDYPCEKHLKMFVSHAHNLVDQAESISAHFLQLWGFQIIDTALLDECFSQDILNHAHIYTKGVHVVYHSEHFVCGTATLDIRKSTFDLKVHTFDNVTVYGNDCEFFAHNESHIIAGKNSIVKIYDNATVDAGANSVVFDYSGRNRSVVNKGVILDIKHNRLYVAKGEYQIIEMPQ